MTPAPLLSAAKVTISGLGRVMKCGASAVLPQVRREYPDEFRDLGTAAHAYLARVPEIGRDAALAEADERHRPALEAIDLAKTPACRPGTRANEVAFAWNWRDNTARLLGFDLNRNYLGLGPTEIAGTADAVGITDDAVIIDDYKAWAPALSARDDWQLTGYALAAAATYGRSRAEVAFIRLRDGEPRHERATLDEIDLAVRAEEVRARMLEIQAHGAEMPPVEGDWCRYCPAFDACPAKQSLALRLAAPLDSMLGAITHENGAKVIAALKASREVLDRIEERLRELAEVDPIPLENGRVYGAYERNLGERVNVDAARRVLVDRYGEAGASIMEASVKRKEEVVKERMREALKPIAEARGGSAARELEAVYRAFREAGATTPKTSRCIGAHKPAKSA